MIWHVWQLRDATTLTETSESPDPEATPAGTVDAPSWGEAVEQIYRRWGLLRYWPCAIRQPSIEPEREPRITRVGLVERYARLEQLSLGLAKEVFVIKKGDDPMLYLERKAYLGRMRDVIAGVETARVLLAKILQRLNDEAQGPARPSAEDPGSS